MIGCYIRFSTKKQDDEMQMHALAGHLERQGISINDVKIYAEDKGISGAVESRPKLNMLLEDVRNGTLHKVIAFEMSRFSRDMLFTASLLKTFKQHNVTVETVNDGVQNFDSSINKFMAFVKGFISEQERQLTSIRTKAALARIKELQKLGPRENKKLIGAPKNNKNRHNKFLGVTSKKIERIKELRSKGYTYRDIAEDVEFSAPKVMRILRRERFCS